MEKSGFNGERLKRLRKIKGFTQTELAHQLNLMLENADDKITDRYVRGWEKEGRTPEPDTLFALSEILECNNDDFFDEIDSSGKKADTKQASYPQVSEYVRDFSSFRNDRTKDFTGREFVFDAIDKFVSKNDRGYFFIKGDPGIGKSSVASELVRQGEYIYHFNIRAEGRNKPRQFLENVCSQLIIKYNLDYKDLPAEKLQDGELLNDLLQEVSEIKKDKEKIIIVIDALDEVDNSGVSDGVNTLYLPIKLPKGFYIVATTRPEPLNLRIDCAQYSYTIDPKSDENRADITNYLKRNCKSKGIKSYIRKQKLTHKSFLEHMEEKSEGNFMYLHYVLPEIEKGAYQDLELDKLPAGLQNYYEDHWRRMGMTDKPLPKDKIKIIYILSLLPEPLSIEQLSKLTNEDFYNVQNVINEWVAFLHDHIREADTKKRYSFYHESFRDFLHRNDIIKAAKVTLPGINDIIAKQLLLRFKT